ncbi:MAG: hypothetical protein ACLSHX_03775 [Suilimivivens sp.]
MEIVSSIVKDQLNRFIIEMGVFAMKKKTIIISGIAAVLVIGSVVFCFAVKGDGTQPAEVAQTVTEAVATPSIEVTQETSEEVSEETSSEVSEPEVEVAEEPEVVEEAPVVEETSSEGSIVDVAETTEEDEDSGVSTQKEEVSSEQSAEPKQEEVKPAETKPVETQPQQTQPQQTTVDAQRDAIIAQLKAMGAVEGIPDSNFEYGNYTGNAGAGFEFE